MITGKELALVGDYGPILNLDAGHHVFKNPQITWNYQDFEQGCFFGIHAGYFKSELFLSDGSRLFVVAISLLETERSPRTFQRNFVKGDKIIFSLPQEAWLAYFIQKEQTFTLNYEQK